MSKYQLSKLSLAAWAPVILAAAGFLGFLSMSLVPPSPQSELVDLGRRVKAAQATALPQDAAREIDQAAATLEAARRSIEHESQKSWRLRSYDRAEALLRQTEKFLERAQDGPPREVLNEAVPAG